jgi:hypothetical protein
MVQGMFGEKGSWEKGFNFLSLFFLDPQKVIEISF